MTYALFALPFLLQGAAITFDEFYFHRKRGLPRWERIGHPLDTATILLCSIFVLANPYSPDAMQTFIGLAVFSTLFITKDEWVHTHECVEEEHWLHSLLFILHPLLLISFALQWITGDPILRQMLLIESMLIFVFMLYQIVYWNFLWKEAKR